MVMNRRNKKMNYKCMIRLLNVEQSSFDIGLPSILTIPLIGSQFSINPPTLYIPLVTTDYHFCF